MASPVENILKKTLSFSGAIFLSRLLGFLREILMAAVLGGGMVASAWQFAFKIPNLFRRIFGEGLIGTVMIPLMAQTVKRSGRENARKRFSTIFLWMTLILSVLTVLVSGVSILCRPFAGLEHVSLALKILPLLMPYCIFICLVGLMTSVLNSIKEFFLPGLVSLMLNLCMIGALLFVCPFHKDSPERMLQSLTLAVLLSGLVELVLILLLLKRKGYLPEISKKVFCRTRVLLEVWVLVLPGLAGAISYQISVLSDAVIAAMVGPYAVAALSYSERLIYLPVGVLGVTIGTVTLAELSSMAGRSELKEFVQTLFGSMRCLLFVMIPLAVFFVIFAEPLIELVYYRGNFTDQALKETTQALFFYAFGLPSFAAMKVTLNGFYARKDMKTPMVVSIVCVALNVVLNLILMHPLKQGGIALATVLTSYLNNFVLILILQLRAGYVPWKTMLIFLLKITVAILPGIYPAFRLFQLLEAHDVHLVLSLPACGMVYMIFFVIFAFLFRMEQTGILLRRFCKRKGAAS